MCFATAVAVAAPALLRGDWDWGSPPVGFTITGMHTYYWLHSHILLPSLTIRHALNPLRALAVAVAVAAAARGFG